MYYFERDYIMRLIHGIAQMLAYLLFGRRMEETPELTAMMEDECRENDDYLRKLIDQGQINAAEDRLFELIESAGWDHHQKAALIIDFYDYVNGKEEAFLVNADFSRDEIITGLEDALKAIGMELPEYLKMDRY